MYTLDYLKSLHVDLEVWDSPGSCFGDEDHFELNKYFSGLKANANSGVF